MNNDIIPSKVKISGSKIKVDYQQYNESIDEYEQVSQDIKEAPKSSFHHALNNLIGQLMQGFEFPSDPEDSGWSRYQPVSVSFKGLMVSGEVKIHEDKHEDPIKVTLPQSNEVPAHIVEDVQAEVKRFLRGERAQGNLFKDQPSFEDNADASAANEPVEIADDGNLHIKSDVDHEEKTREPA